MEYRNLNRVFTFNKAFRAWRREEGYDSLKGSHINIMLSPAQFGTGGVGLVRLFGHLKRFGRQLSYNEIQIFCNEMCEYGLVSISGRYPAVYSLTLFGKNALNALEKRCRETR